MANKKDRHPKAYFDAARGYQSAADRLLLSIESGEKLLIRDPAYFLYAHAVELALKACLLSCGFDPASSGPAGHGIEGLHRECLGHKLLGTNDADRGIIRQRLANRVAERVLPKNRGLLATSPRPNAHEIFSLKRRVRDRLRLEATPAAVSTDGQSVDAQVKQLREAAAFASKTKPLMPLAFRHAKHGGTRQPV
jgi:hypothetical protein